NDNETRTITDTDGAGTTTDTRVTTVVEDDTATTLDNDLRKSTSWSSSMDISRVDQVVNALKQRGNARILASPSIIVKNNSTGQIFAGSTTLIAEGGTETGNAKISLDVTPFTGAGNLINLAVILSTSTPVGWDGSGNLVSSTQSLTSNVQINSGESVVIGGLKTTGYSKQSRGVPVLEKVPLIKKIFTKNEKRVSYNELIVFITPRVLKTDYTDAESLEKMSDFEKSQTEALKIPPKQIEE
ncbi:MAG: type II and III secretion system protein, partial [bacterium]